MSRQFNMKLSEKDEQLLKELRDRSVNIPNLFRQALDSKLKELELIDTIKGR